MKNYLLCLLAFLISPIVLGANQDLSAEDMQMLAGQIAKQINACPKWSGVLTVADFKNKTSESIDKQLFVNSVLSKIKNIAPMPSGPKLSMEIVSMSIERNGEKSSLYVVSARAMKGKKILCNLKTRMNKANGDDSP